MQSKMDPRVNGIRYTGARLGVFGLESWAPLRKPGQPLTASSVSSVCQSDKQSVSSGHSAMVRSEQPLPQQQKPRHEAPLSAMHVEYSANHNGNNSPNAVKPSKLLL